VIRALNDSDWDVRSGAAEALGRIGEPAVEPLINALNNSDTTGVRVNAAQALGRIGDSRAVKPLERALNDADSRVRKSAAEALRRFGLQENRWGPLTEHVYPTIHGCGRHERQTEDHSPASLKLKRRVIYNCFSIKTWL